MKHDTEQACLDACTACAEACERCAAACLKEDDVTMLARCIVLDLDCAAICRLSASYIAHGSESAASACVLCEDVCRRCADECGRHEHAHCRRCAKACLACAEACAAMSA
ncbi:four-helix bundle copper-binding protein [Rubrivivax gelatinosus]|uniref:Four-helix bundle copper-binding protein n=1 Tax=Rubrivivax gelatinosus TaxID=28068 RepID=A0ABS1DQN3_RUBGE|nr:four-helix bundle copper-binding protein [Rubrivivax gelatinosus]MBK1711880.1 four-helix bundle copper-binding protein [Rubrivivax gelatinosus]